MIFFISNGSEKLFPIWLGFQTAYCSEYEERIQK